MSKQTIAQILTRKRYLLLRIRRDANEVVDLDTKIEKMRAGKIKTPPPPGKKVMLRVTRPADVADWISDHIPEL